MSQKLENGGSVVVSLRQYFETKITEMDQRQTLAITALKDLIITRLDSMDKASISLAFSSQKAIDKSEAAQADYNMRSNEFRGQLDDQAKTLMPRSETIGLFKSYEDKLNVVFNTLEKRADENKRDIASLRETRSEFGGERAAHRDARAQFNWGVGVSISIGVLALSVIGLIITVIKFSRP